MHKVLFIGITTLFLLVGGVVQAQERVPLFSPSLFTGTDYYRVKGKKVTQKTPVARQRMVLRFEEGVTDLNEEQKRQLLPFVRRAQQGQISELQVTVFSKIKYHSYLRIRSVQGYFDAFVPSLRVRGRSAPLPSVMEGNRNTADVVEIK